MNFLATFRVALAALRANPLRSALTMLGIVIGVAAVITMIAVGSGARQRVETQIRSMGSNLMIVLSGSMTSGGVRLGTGAGQMLTEDDAWAMVRDIPEIQVAAPVVRGSGQVVIGNQNWLAAIYGITPEYLEAREWKIAEGRAFDAGDMSGAAKVALVGQTVARQLFGEESPIGQTVRVRNVPVAIVGVLERKGQSLVGQDQDDVVMVPIATARNRVLGSMQGRLRRVSNITVKAEAEADIKEVEERVRELMRQRHKVQPGGEDTVNIRNLTEMLQAQEESSRALALLLAAIASVSLLVGGIGIMNIMLVSVTERTREIGLRMAVGARRRDILTQFLVEAATLSFLGGVVGIVLGAVAAWAIARFAGWQVALSPAAIVLAAGFAAAVGIFFGYYPARRAAGLTPIEALRRE